MRRKFLLYFNIWCLLSVILAPIIIVTFFYYQDFYQKSIIEFVCGSIFVSAYLLFPSFFIYQLFTRIRNREKTRNFTISLITFFVILLSILFYIGLYWIIDEAVTNVYRNDT